MTLKQMIHNDLQGFWQAVNIRYSKEQGALDTFEYTIHDEPNFNYIDNQIYLTIYYKNDRFRVIWNKQFRDSINEKGYAIIHSQFDDKTNTQYLQLAFEYCDI